MLRQLKHLQIIDSAPNTVAAEYVSFNGIFLYDDRRRVRSTLNCRDCRKTGAGLTSKNQGDQCWSEDSLTRIPY